MKNIFKVGFWEFIARIVLKNRLAILCILLLITIFLGLQWKNIRFTFTEANLLPDNNQTNKEYNAFLDKFGEEGNLMVIGVQDDALFTPKAFAAWNKLMNGIKANKTIDLVVSIKIRYNLNSVETL